MDLIGLVVSFCAGVYGAALGGVISIILAAVCVLIGVLVPDSPFNFIGWLSFGLYLGPYLSFAPACVAAAYASKKGYLANSKDILTPLISLQKVSPLIVGGIFGTLGYVIQYSLANFLGANHFDTAAATVVIISLIGKVAFGKDGLFEVMGRSPEEVKKAGGRFSPSSPVTWLPWQSKAPELTMLGIALGGLGGWIAYMLVQNPVTAGVATLPGWALGLFCFIFFAFGFKIPCVHHITMISALAVVQSYDVYHSSICLLWGLAFGVIGAFCCEYLARAFTVFGHGYVDPPAFAIAVCSLLINTFLVNLGVFNDKFIIPLVILLVAIAYSIYEHRVLKNNLVNEVDEVNDTIGVAD